MRENGRHGSGGKRDVHDEKEGGEQEDANDNDGNNGSLKVISSGVVTVLPDDIGRLRGIFELKGLAE